MSKQNNLKIFLLCNAVIISSGLCWAAPKQQGLKSHAMLDAANKKLLMGSMICRIDIVTSALNHGAQPNTHDLDGNTPLGEVADGAQMSGAMTVTKILLSHSANPNSRQVYGLTPLIRAANHPDRSAASTKRSVDVIQLLLAHGAKINAQDDRGNTALMDAAYWGNASVVQILLRNSADTRLINKAGRTALKMAHARVNTLKQKQQQNVVIKMLTQAQAVIKNSTQTRQKDK